MKRIDFELAKKLKEIGCPQNYSSCYYTKDGEFFDWNEIEEWDDKFYDKISVMDFNDVLEWLRNEKKIHIPVDCLNSKWEFRIKSIDGCDDLLSSNPYYFHCPRKWYDSYDDAVEAAIWNICAMWKEIYFNI